MTDEQAEDKTQARRVMPDGDVLAEIFRQARHEAAMRVSAEASGPFDSEDQAALGVNADGTIAAGGLTDAGVQMASTIAEELSGIAKSRFRAERSARDTGAGGKEPGGMEAAVDALGMRGPVRAAIRAGAQALAAALNDGRSDDEGLLRGDPSEIKFDADDEHEHEDGRCVRKVRLGHVPFVLIQQAQVPGEPDGVTALTLATGGVKYRRDAEPGEPSVEDMLEGALEAVDVAGDNRSEGVIIDKTTDGIPEDVGAAFVEMLRSRLGAAATTAMVRSGKVARPRRARSRDGAAEAEAQSTEAMGLDDFRPGYGAAATGPMASGSGPSTEDPAPPSWDERPETATPDAPPCDAPRSEPAPSTSDAGSSDSAGSTGGSD